MATSNDLRFAGEVKVQRVEIVTTQGFGQDITNQCRAIEIFEDLFAPFTSGTLIIDDSLDLVNLFPLRGEEYLNLKISTPTLDKRKDLTSSVINHKFYIYRATDRVVLGDSRVTYRLHFVNVDYLTDANVKLSKPFSGNGSDIASTIVKSSSNLNSSKSIFVEESANNIKFVSNYWSPTEAINYAVGKSFNRRGIPSYVFYEDRQGYNFRTIDNLIQQPIIQKFVYDRYTRTDAGLNSSIRDIDEDYKRIETFSVPDMHDYMEATKSGTYSSKLITHDLVTKAYSSRNFNMLQYFNPERSLNKNALVSSSNVTRSNARILVNSKHNNAFNQYPDVTDSAFVQLRTSLMRLIETHRVHITVPGRTDYTVGKKVHITTYKNNPRDETHNNDLIDKVYTGNYLIGAINHYIGRERHECTMQLIKDSTMYETEGNKS